MQLEQLRILSKNRNGGLAQIAREVNMMPPSLHRAISANEMKASNLERIARVMKVPVQTFFDEDVHVSASPNNSVTIGRDHSGNIHQSAEGNVEKIKFLEKLLAEKDNIIAEKERLIQVLMAQKS